MKYERYRLILKHEYIDEDMRNTYQIEEPLVMDYMISKNEMYYSSCEGVLLNRLMDWFKHEILRIKGED